MRAPDGAESDAPSALFHARFAITVPDAPSEAWPRGLKLTLSECGRSRTVGLSRNSLRYAASSRWRFAQRMFSSATIAGPPYIRARECAACVTAGDTVVPDVAMSAVRTRDAAGNFRAAIALAIIDCKSGLLLRERCQRPFV